MNTEKIFSYTTVMKAKTNNKAIFKVLKVLLISAIIGIIALATVFFCIYFSVKLDYDGFVKANAHVEIYDGADNIITAPNSVDCYVKYDDMSPHIVHAFISLEDKRFYEHHGIDIIRIGGAALANIKAGYMKEGGSTITQQLAKNSQLTNEKKFTRKIKEMRLAREIEKHFTKEEIIETYLNTIYFGNGIYGIKNACKSFFDKLPEEILPYEAAMLAGVVNNPKKNSPLSNPENAESRKNLVLRLMYEQEFLTDEEYGAAVTAKYSLPKTAHTDYVQPYYNSVIAEARSLLGISEKEIISEKYRIYTYLDDTVQKSMFDAYQSEAFIVKNSADGQASSNALMTDNSTGGITGYFSNHNYSAFELRRQPGSVLKPLLVYAPALNSGYISPSSQYNDEKVSLNGYSPSNYEEKYYGWIDIRTSIAKSSNSVAAQLLNEIGIEYAKSNASAMGIPFAPADDTLSLALGGMTYGMTAIELTGGYMCLANGGLYTQPVFIRKITDESGKILYSHTPSFKRIFSEEASYLLTDMLIDTVKSGTASKLKSLPFQLAAKTGTAGSNTQEYNSDAWNISYTRDNTLCVWYGNLTGLKENDVATTGGAYPTYLAKYLYEKIGVSPKNFYVPENIIELRIDTLALKDYHRVMLASPYTPFSYTKNELFDLANIPEETSTLFIPPKLNINIVTGDGNYPKLYFDTEEAFTYKIYKKCGMLARNNLLSEVKGSSGKYIYTDCARNEYLFNWYVVEVIGKTGDVLCREEIPFISLD